MDLAFEVSSGGRSSRHRLSGSNDAPDGGSAGAAARLFVAAAAAGMFCGERCAPWASRAAITGPHAGTPEVVRIDLDHVDLAAFDVLRNLLAAAAAEAGHELISDPRDAEPTTLHYPGTWPGSVIERSVELPSKSTDPLTVHLTFSASLDDAAERSTDALLRLWGALVRRKGYSPRLVGLPDESVCEDQEIYLFSDCEIETVLYGFDADAAAIDALLNGLEKLRHGGASLAGVEVW